MLHRGRFGRPALAVVAGLALSLVAGDYARAADAPHRALRAALYHLKEAKEDLKSERFKRERRERAEKEIERAIREIERGLKEGKVEARYEPAKEWDKGFKDFRHLRQALVELDEARKELKEEKGEWARRKELLEAIDDAHKHTKEALEDLK
jgi:predicted ribosome quality control (RQC) complex YloA/Tae2 family protein